jgi:hypothetical protein
MGLREVAVGFGLMLFACVRVPVVDAPTVLVVQPVQGHELLSASDKPAAPGAWRSKDEVEVEWRGTWWPAVVLERRPRGWLVHYEGYSADWEEIVAAERIRERRVGLSPTEPDADDDEPDP